MPDRSGRLPLWGKIALPLVTLGIALLVGSGLFDQTPATAAQRAAAIEANVRCPSCTDVSVAQSQNTTAIAVRHQIEHLVAEGQSTAAIQHVLVSEYGPTILLTPPDAAGLPLIWIIPVVLGAGALAGVGMVFWRRSRAFEALKVGAPSP